MQMVDNRISAQKETGLTQFSLLLANNPNKRNKRLIALVQAFIEFKKRNDDELVEWNLNRAQ
ncbi:hypothetical protein D3C73_538800 [compost metagenome]